jgi:hypothetical protein
MNMCGSPCDAEQILYRVLTEQHGDGTAGGVLNICSVVKQRLQLERTARDGYENYGGPWLAQPCKPNGPNGGARGAAAAVIALATDCARV